MHLFAIILLSLTSSEALKILVYNALFAHSHVNFAGKIAETLGEAGHKVVMLSPQVDIHIKNYTSPHISRTIYIPANDVAKSWPGVASEFGKLDLWTGSPDMRMIVEPIVALHRTLASQCESTLFTPGLLDALRAEKFDAALGETYDLCAFVLFKKIGIEKYAMTYSLTAMDYNFEITGVPDLMSYVPSLLSKSMDVMSFGERIINVLGNAIYRYLVDIQMAEYKPVIDRIYPEFGFSKEILAEASFLFVNYDPLVDFAKLTTAKIIGIGGIAVPDVGKPLEQKWDKVLSLRPRTVLMAFGSIIRSSTMPHHFKDSIRASFKKFPNTTFIWKYEDESHRISDGVPNLIETKWMPQIDLFRDGRLSAFITNAGSGSAMEALKTGIPMIATPLISDGPRNANVAKMMGTTIVLDRDDLGREEVLTAALSEMLNSDKYFKEAKHVAAMLRNQPMTSKERLVKNVEFMANYGPFKHLDHHGRKLNFIQYYLLDVYGALSVVAIFLVAVVYFSFKKIFNHCFLVQKTKVE